MKAVSLKGLPDLPKALAVKDSKVNSDQIVFEERTRLIRNLIWLYFVLWLIEGGLRRWFLPGLATPLLLIRDPLVVAIYCCAFAKGVFPANGFILAGVLLAVLTLVYALFVGHGNLLVALYGVRCDFLHVPLIFIMGAVIRPKDLIALAKIAVLISIPYTVLLVAQFYAPQDAWVNRGVGGSLEGAGFDGAQGRFRPPGTFSFITGTAQLYTLLTACWFTLVLARKFSGWMMIASGVAILVAVPVSVSRTLFLSVGLVAVVGIGALACGGRFSVQMFFRVLLVAIILPILALQLPAFKDGMEAFGSRWETATSESGGFKEAIIDRVVEGLFGDFGAVGDSGLGTGFSTNVGQKILTQEMGMGAAEAEWGRLLWDNGLFLGSLVIIYRAALTASIVFASLRALRHRSPTSLIFAAAALPLVFNGQWKQPATLGAAVIAGGLVLAAAGYIDRDDSSPLIDLTTSKHGHP
jgi:hypothetical protein